MRILHSSDWHLGLQLGGVSLGDDHDRFLGWLLDVLRAEQVDALIVAGDIFDQVAPSAEAQARLYGFLARVGSTGLPQVVLIGGNHDSPSRLDAPAEVLAALKVHVVGGFDPQHPERCVLPLHDRAGRVGAVCVALPYVHEFRLGVRTTDPDPAQVRASFAERFGALYRGLCDLAAQQYPNIPVVATGHLTMGSARAEDYPQAIHQVGSLDALPESLVDPRIQYLALGHIHRSYPVAGRRGWYSGTPIATSLPEAATPRRVLRVDLSPDPAGAPDVHPLFVPRSRALLRVEGDPESLCGQLRALRWDDPLPPLVFAVVALDAPAPDLVPRLEAALAAHPEGRRPRLARLEVAAAPLPDGAPPAPALAQLRPEEVLEQLCALAGVTDRDGIRAAFAALATASAEDWDARLKQIDGGVL